MRINDLFSLATEVELAVESVSEEPLPCDLIFCSCSVVLADELLLIV